MRNWLYFLLRSLLGTWPSYRRTLDFILPFHYILASTSFNSNTYNCTSHLTFPLFHSDYPSNIISSSSSSRSILLSFKGKSYEDVQHHRTFFRHLNNNHDIIIKYTDNETNSSDKFEYIQLLRQSYFCLVPTGRRLYSYRFLEVLQYGCIPVITTNENELLILPFSEIIDWSKSIILYSNLSLSLLPHYLRMMNENQRNDMQSKCFNIWLKYFSSIQRIVLTSLDILNDRFMSSFSFSIHS
jgi:glucuronyl/N-acetylglucosaminyl transferase EXT1